MWTILSSCGRRRCHRGVPLQQQVRSKRLTRGLWPELHDFPLASIVAHVLTSYQSVHKLAPLGKSCLYRCTVEVLLVKLSPRSANHLVLLESSKLYLRRSVQMHGRAMQTQQLVSDLIIHEICFALYFLSFLFFSTPFSTCVRRPRPITARGTWTRTRTAPRLFEKASS